MAAAGSVLVRDRDPAEARLGLAELDQLLEVGVGQVLAVEQAQDAGVGGGLLGRPGIDCDGDLTHAQGV